MSAKKVCEQCGVGFTARPREAGRKFCSRSCKMMWKDANGERATSRTPVHFNCRECAKPFVMMQSYLDVHRKRFGKDPAYCSIPCSAIGRKKDGDERHKTTCKNCGKEFYKTRRPGSGTVYGGQILCSRECHSEWVGKVYRQKHGPAVVTKRVRRGYVMLHIPAANGTPHRDILEHRYVMEQHLGRSLTEDETVHHINGDREDNALSNLELWSSRHGPGQRADDKVAFAIEMLRLYPEFAREAGVELREVAHPTDPDEPL